MAQLLIITTSRVSGIDDLKRKHAMFQDFHALMNRTQDRNSPLGRSLQRKKLEMTTKLTCTDDSAWPLQRCLIHAVDARVVFW